MSTSPISDVTVLAAIDRAVRHRVRPVVPIWSIFEHLGIPRRSRRARTQLYELVQAGAVERSRVRSIEQFSLTSAGRGRLRRAGEVELPESPQHQEWRNAQVLAAQEIERFRDALRELLADAGALLDSGAPSDVWFELAERLERTARRLGSATYCLYEWAEPSDGEPDVDDRCEPDDEQLDPLDRQRRRARRAGRRNVGRWSADWC
jgi:DNA-binding transcriptional regulator PaaX